jgi:hypothetical protein
LLSLGTGKEYALARSIKNAAIIITFKIAELCRRFNLVFAGKVGYFSPMPLLQALVMPDKQSGRSLIIC